MTPDPSAASPPGAAPPARTRAAIAWSVVSVAAGRFGRDLGFEKAASLAYSSLLAVVPAVLLAVSVIELLAVDGRRRVLDSLLDLLFPVDARGVRDGFHEYFESSRTAFVSGDGSGVRIVSLLLLVYFTLKVIATIDRVVGHIWGSGAVKAPWRRFAAWWAVVTLGPVLLGLSFAGTAIAGELLGESAGGLLRAVFPFLVTTTAVCLFYKLVPQTRVRGVAVLAAAAVAALLWELLKVAFGWWFARPQPSLLTALSFFPAALLWMYTSWAILLYGLEVAYVVHHGTWREGLRARGGVRPGAERDVVALAAMIEIARAFDAGETLDRGTLAERLDVAEDGLGDALEGLEAAGLVALGTSGGYAPARGAAGISALDAVRVTRGEASVGTSRSASMAVAARFVAGIGDGGRAAGKASVAELVSEARACRPDGG